MRTLSRDQKCVVIRYLCDGVSIAATTRITGVAKNTIQKLTRELGQAVLDFQNVALRMAITFTYHNFLRVHQTIKTTPAVAAGIAKHRWTVGDMVDLLRLTVAGKRGPYKRRISD